MTALSETQKKWCVRVFVLLFFIRLLSTAWIAEDAMISLRQAKNLADGYGFVWNVGERVLAVTNPLWTLLMALFTFVLGHPLHVVLGMCFVFSMTAISFFVWKTASEPFRAIPALIAMIGSRYFVDYSTSGLESPLVNLLLFAFLFLYTKSEIGPKIQRYMSLCIGLALMCRPDLALIMGPLMLLTLKKSRDVEAWKEILLGALPFLLWCAVAFLYFGSPIPNTAFAKMSHGFGGMEVFNQGIIFFKWSFIKIFTIKFSVHIP